MTNASRHQFPWISQDRMFEWAMAFILVGLGVHLAIWPQAIVSSAFRYLYFIVGADSLGMFYLVVGLARIAALITNGHSRIYGPIVRMVGAAWGAAIWLQMDVSLIKLITEQEQSVPSPGIPVYFILAVFEILSVYRAAADAQYRT